MGSAGRALAAWIGFVTTAGRQGVRLGDAMALSGHRGTAVALRGSFRQRNLADVA